MTFEVMVDSVESAISAEHAGVHRLELCADLLEGGITPSYGMIKHVRESVKIPVNVMIRPRGGDFYYTEHEFEIMAHDIDMAKSLDVNGVVLGILDMDGQVDVDRMRLLVEQARPLSVTFHRAIDMTPNPFPALDALIAIGIDRVLTSGQQQTAEQGMSIIAKMVDQTQGRISIMAGSGINPDNVRKIVDTTRVHEIHFSAREQVDSPMRYRQPHLSMSGAIDHPEYRRTYANPDTIRAIITAVTKDLDE